jgi:hypothetical protein
VVEDATGGRLARSAQRNASDTVALLDACGTTAGSASTQVSLLQHEADPSREVVMQQHQSRSLSQRFQQYQASKAVLFWACAGSVIVAAVVGFTWGGWVTGGSAQKMAANAAAQGRQEVAAVVCIDRFMAAPDVGVQLTALKGISSSYQREKFVQDGGWAIMPTGDGDQGTSTKRSSSRDDREAAGLCAEELAKREVPAIGPAAANATEAAVVQ